MSNPLSLADAVAEIERLRDNPDAAYSGYELDVRSDALSDALYYLARVTEPAELRAEVERLKAMLKPRLESVMSDLAEDILACSWFEGLYDSIMERIKRGHPGEKNYRVQCLTEFAELALTIGEAYDDAGYRPLTDHEKTVLQDWLKAELKSQEGETKE